MTLIHTFATLLGVSDAPVPKFTDAESAYLAGFVNGLRNSGADSLADRIPALPAGAPLPGEKRLWLEGLLAGLFSRAPAPRPAGEAGHAESAAAPGGVRVLHARPRVQLLWASQTGNIESLTEDYATSLMQAGFEIRMACMDSYGVENLAKAQYVLLMSSTFGDGDPPDNGQTFWDGLRADGAPDLAGVSFAVLAFGDRNYDQFCGHGRNLDERLAALGGRRLMERVDCDVEFQAGAAKWLEQAIVRIKEADAALYSAASHEQPAGAVATKLQPARSRLAANARLNRDGSAKDTRYLALAQGPGIEYEPGDALGVWPANCPELVDELLGLLGLKADAPVALEGLGEMALGQALGRHLDITRPHAQALAWIAAQGRHEALMSLLGEERKADLKAWLWGRQLADVLHEFPASIAAGEFVSLLPRLQPRLYSIASSPLAHPGEVHLTVSAVRYGHGRRARKGVASTFLADRAGADVPVFVQKSAHFRLPAQSDAPVIMVGPGTGIAPFRGFLHQRRAEGARGRNWLFFGEQREQTDFYYRDEIAAMCADGLLTRLDLAFSRDQAGKVYVQDRMRERGAQLWAWLQEGASFYVCGDAMRMARDVDAALKDVVAEHGGMPAQQAGEYVARLAREKRYVRDVY